MGHVFQGRYRAIVCDKDEYLLIRRLGYRLREVSLGLGRDVATVSSLIFRFSARMAKDAELKRQVERIVKIV